MFLDVELFASMFAITAYLELNKAAEKCIYRLFNFTSYTESHEKIDTSRIYTNFMFS